MVIRIARDRNLKPLPTIDTRMNLRLSKLKTPADIAKILYGIGVNAEISIAQRPYLLISISVLHSMESEEIFKSIDRPNVLPNQWPITAPITDETVVNIPSQIAISGLMIDMLTSRGSGGIGKNIDSVIDNKLRLSIPYSLVAKPITHSDRLLSRSMS